MDKRTADYIESCVEKASLSYMDAKFELAGFYQRAAEISLLQSLVDEVAALRADLAKRG